MLLKFDRKTAEKKMSKSKNGKNTSSKHLIVISDAVPARALSVVPVEIRKTYWEKSVVYFRLAPSGRL